MQKSTEIVVGLLEKGLSPTEIANIVGCSCSAISQIKEKYKERIDVALADRDSSISFQDSKLDQLEQQLIERMEQSVGFEMDPMKLTKMFQVVNNAKRRSKGEGRTPAVVQQNNVVHLNVGHYHKHDTAPKYTVSPRNEVVAVDGRNLTVATSKQIKAIASKHAETKELTPDDFIIEKPADKETTETSTGTGHTTTTADEADDIPYAEVTSISTEELNTSAAGGN